METGRKHTQAGVNAGTGYPSVIRRFIHRSGRLPQGDDEAASQDCHNRAPVTTRNVWELGQSWDETVSHEGPSGADEWFRPCQANGGEGDEPYGDHHARPGRRRASRRSQAGPRPGQGRARKDVYVFYGDKQALFDVSLDMPEKSVTALIGPSGCGKSTFLRSINRMNDTIPNCRVTGQIEIDGEDVNAKSVDPVLLRARVGMVFQKPNPFPKSIFDNVAYGVRLHGLASVARRRWRRSSRSRCARPACGTR